MKKLLFILLIIVSSNAISQNNVGIGTLTPNANAALEVQSTDKGLLIPRLTTAQRNIFGVGLANTENSMLVYDVNDSVFYYWKSTLWIPIPGVATDNQNIDSVRLNPLDSVLTVYIEDGLSASVNLKSAFDNKDEQTLTITGDSLEISNGNKVLFIDNDTTNEKIDSVTYLNDTLTVYEGDNVYKTEIIGGEWSDADKIGLTNFIYAKQALNNGAADTVAITDEGKLGVGTASPRASLDVADLTPATIKSILARLPEANNIGQGTFLGVYSGNTQPVGNMKSFSIIHKFYDTLNSAINFYRGGTYDDGYMTFDTDNGMERMRIAYNGNIGIGTTNPSNLLHVVSPTNPLRLEGVQNGVSTDSILTIDATGIIKKIPNSIRSEWNDADSIGMNGFVYAKQALTVGGTDTVVITDNGNVGIGMSNPLAKLHVDYGNVLVGKDADFASTYVSPGSIELYRDSILPIYAENGFIDFKYAATNDADFRIAMRDGGLATERIDINVGTSNGLNSITLTKGGNVGMGTITPTDKLQINGNVRVGLINEAGIIQPEGWGNIINFSGGPDVSAAFNSDNSDPFWMGRYNIVSDLSELRVRLGDNGGVPDNDAFVIGATSPLLPWVSYFRVQSNGFTGIGVNPTTYPTNQLHVIANANPLRLQGLQKGAAIDSVLTVSNTGVVRQSANPMPPGSIISFAGAAAPAGFVICDGSAVSRTDYADLFAVIGTTYGVGNGATTFNLPDLRGEFIRGADAGKGVDPGRTLGSKQLASPVVGDDNTAPNDYSMEVNGQSPQFFDGYDPAYAAVNMWYSAGTTYVYNPGHAGFMKGSRPRNVALNYIIRY